MNSTLLYQSLILTLNFLVTLTLWLNYRNSRRPYLALVTIAGTTEIARLVVDTFIVLVADSLVFYHLSGSLKFCSTLLFLSALLRLQDPLTRLVRRVAALTIAFVVINIVQQLMGFTGTILEWYVYFSPIILAHALIPWRARFITPSWPLTRIYLVVASSVLLLLRSWLPALYPAPDEFYTAVYYLDSLLFPLMLGALNFAAIEETQLRLQTLLREQAELRKQQAAVERDLRNITKLEGLSVLAGGIAHDFNNILMGLFGNLSLAKEELSTDHRAWPLLKEAEGSMTRATQLSGQLLTFAKGGAPTMEPIQLGALLEKLVRFDLSGSTVRAVVRHQPGLWTAHVDEGQMQQVFANLTINARQAMPDGGEFHVELENARMEEGAVPGLNPGEYVRVVVRDTGTGIEEKHLDQVFDPYFSTKQSGRGLGLATAYSIVTRHGGQIRVESTRGEGTTFTIYLPACKSPSPPDAQQPAPRHHSPTRDANVLLLDDDERVRETARQMIEKIGYSVVTASDGAEAIDRYKRALQDGRPFDVVILDLTIPGGMGGKDALAGILASDPDATAIVSSGYGNDPVMCKPADHGFKGVVAKPYTMQQLEAVLQQALE